MKLFIVDTINNIPSHKQFQDLARSLAEKGHKVIHISDSKRDSYEQVKVIYLKNRLKNLPLFFYLLKKERPNAVISTFSSNIVFDVLRYFFSFKFYPVYQSDFFRSGMKYQFYYRKATKLLAVSNPIKCKIENQFYPHLKGKVAVIGNSFVFAQTENFNKENIILCVGNSSKNNQNKYVKGIDVLLDAWRNLPNHEWKLRIIGCDEANFTSTPEEDVEFMGKLTHREVLQQMNLAKVFVLPSRNDAFPNVFLEAMSRSCALIGTKNTGAEDIIIEGDYGRLVRQEAPDELAMAISSLMSTYESHIKCEKVYQEKIQFCRRDNWVDRVSNLILKDR